MFFHKSVKKDILDSPLLIQHEPMSLALSNTIIALSLGPAHTSYTALIVEYGSQYHGHTLSLQCIPTSHFHRHLISDILNKACNSADRRWNEWAIAAKAFGINEWYLAPALFGIAVLALLEQLGWVVRAGWQGLLWANWEVGRKGVGGWMDEVGFVELDSFVDYLGR